MRSRPKRRMKNPSLLRRSLGSCTFPSFASMSSACWAISPYAFTLSCTPLFCSSSLRLSLFKASNWFLYPIRDSTPTGPPAKTRKRHASYRPGRSISNASMILRARSYHRSPMRCQYTPCLPSGRYLQSSDTIA